MKLGILMDFCIWIVLLVGMFVMLNGLLSYMVGVFLDCCGCLVRILICLVINGFVVGVWDMGNGVLLLVCWIDVIVD